MGLDMYLTGTIHLMDLTVFPRKRGTKKAELMLQFRTVPGQTLQSVTADLAALLSESATGLSDRPNPRKSGATH